jgi:hypothetical protein
MTSTRAATALGARVRLQRAFERLLRDLRVEGAAPPDELTSAAPWPRMLTGQRSLGDVLSIRALDDSTLEAAAVLTRPTRRAVRHAQRPARAGQPRA